MLVYLPFYLGDSVLLLTQAVTRLSLLLTVYVFALYGIQQVTRSAYLRGSLNATSQATPPTKEPHTDPLLDEEEITYLHHLMGDEDESDPNDNSVIDRDKKKD